VVEYSVSVASEIQQDHRWPGVVLFVLFGLAIESTMLMLAFFVLLVMVSILLIAIAADAGLVIDLILLSILAFFGWRQFLFGY